MKTKILAVILVIVCLCSMMFTGCGSNNDGIVDSETENTGNNGSAQETVKQDGLIDIDPFEHVFFYTYGKSGEATLEEVAHAFIRLGDHIQDTLIKVTVPDNNGSVKNGDLIHVSLGAEVDHDRIAREYGIRFTRTEGDIEIHGLNAYGQPDASNGEHAVVNLNNYVSCTTLGRFNGEGGLQVTINYDQILKEYGHCLSENVAPKDLSNYEMSRYMASHIFQYLPPVSVVSPDYNCGGGHSFTDIYGEFSNGDVVDLTWEVNDENLAKLQKVMNVEFIYEDFTASVEGLIEYMDFDPFKDLQVYFGGTNGSGTAYAEFPIKENGFDFMCEAIVIAENNGSLSNGDTIIVSVAELTRMLESYGLIVTRTEIEVEVSGLE